MTKKLTFRFLFVVILAIALAIRLAPARNNNIYFTMDQGNDAVHVREILHRHQILLKGPETGIAGFHHGPLWYYFISIGYLITDGHPFGSVLMLILLNVATTAILMIVIARKVSQTAALTVGASLQFFWWFYDTSRFGFNPFPLVALSIFLILLLIKWQEGKRWAFVAATIPIGLAFHSESAGGVAFLIFYSLIALWSLLRQKLSWQIVLAACLTLGLFFVPRLVSEIKSDFSQTKVIRRELRNPTGVFAETRFRHITVKFQEILTKRITPQSNEVGIAVLIIVFFSFLKTSPKNAFTKRFTYLSLLLVLISWTWFATNKGWQVWHTVYIRPLLFISIILMLFNIPGKLGKVLLIAILISQILFFKDRYFQFATASQDPSLLTNEIATVDWVYQKSADLGFYVYSYLPSVYDYPYQYLFWWRATREYGYVPCEYSTFPDVPDFFVPGVKHYQSPQKPCTNLRFLIIEPDVNQNNRQVWLDQVRSDTILLEEASFGNIKVEKRQL